MQRTFNANDAQDIHTCVGKGKNKELLSREKTIALIPLAKEAVKAAERLEKNAELEIDNQILSKDAWLKRGEETLSEVEKCRLLEIVAAGKPNLDELIVRNLRLVAHVAKKFAGRCPNIEMSDLITEGVLGLIHAIGKFEIEQRKRLSTYAVWWIRQSIQRAVANQARTVRLPVHVQKKLAKLRSVVKQLQESLRRAPAVQEIAFWMNMETEEIRELIELDQKPYSLDFFAPGEEDAPLDNFLNDIRQLPADEISEKNAVPKLAEELLAGLRPREREVMVLRFGLKYGREPESLSQVGRKLKITKERVRQIQARAEDKIRRNQAVKAYM